MTMQLSEAALASLRTRDVGVPGYDRSQVTSGVLHFGPGAFHRVHQAFYFDELLQNDPRWGITEVALQSTGVRDALAPQAGLYTLCILDEEIRYRVIGAIRECLVARESADAVLNRLADPATHLVTATITEKGYCLNADGGLDSNHEAIHHDLEHPHDPRTFVGFLVEGLRRRHAANSLAPTVISCDNLTDNGGRLRRATLEFAHERSSGLARWIEDNVSFPCTMVDSITPATDDVLRARVAREIGVEDRWPVQREAFTQWVIEDALHGPCPDFASVGVTVTNDVAGFERAKLRLLNGMHSTLAYVGLLAGYETVSQAMADAYMADFLGVLLKEIKPSVTAPKGLDVDAYSASLLKRFRNPALPHRLAQIAWDGSQKIPYRLLGTIKDNLAHGRPIDRLAYSVAAWFHFIARRARQNDPPVDPMAKELCEVGTACGGDAAADVQRFLGLRQVFPTELAREDKFRAPLITAYRRLGVVREKSDLQSALFGVA